MTLADSWDVLVMEVERVWMRLTRNVLLIKGAFECFPPKGRGSLFLSLSSVQKDLVLSQVLTPDRDEQSLN